jgi:hypothetical protein
MDAKKERIFLLSITALKPEKNPVKRPSGYLLAKAKPFLTFSLSFPEKSLF